MKRLKVNSKEWREQVLRQNFYPHEKSNGHVIMVSLDGRYYYEPEY